jgi:hypothetical protein
MIDKVKKTESINGDNSKTLRVTITSPNCSKQDSMILLPHFLKMVAESQFLYKNSNPCFDLLKLSHDGERWVAVFTTTIYEKNN